MNDYLSKNTWWIAGVAILVLLAPILIWQNHKAPSSPTLRVGISIGPDTGLLNIATDKNFFEEEGLKVELKEFTGGKFALQALLGGSLDIVTVGEFPITLATLNGSHVSILSQINETFFQMLLRKDGEKAFDPKVYFAKKRKIATSVGAGPEFFAAQFFEKYNIPPTQYEIVSMKPEDTPVALANGSVDGIAIYEPFPYFAEQRTGAGKLFIIDEADIYTEFMLVAARAEWINQNRDAINKFLNALKKAQDFAKTNPEESAQIISNFTKIDEDTVKSILPKFTFRLALTNKLVSAMQEEAQWAKDAGKVTQDTLLPDFRNVIFEQSLKEVAPYAVGL